MTKIEQKGFIIPAAEGQPSSVGPVSEVIGMDFIRKMRDGQRRLEEIAIGLFGEPDEDEIVVGGGIHKGPIT